MKFILITDVNGIEFGEEELEKDHKTEKDKAAEEALAQVDE